MILWLWTALLSAMVLFPLFDPKVNVFIPVGVAAMGVGLYTWFHPGLRRHDSEEPTGAAEAPARIGGSRREVQ